MIKEFLEGETYTNPKLDKDILVYAVAKETSADVTLAIMWIDRSSRLEGQPATTEPGELVVKKSDFGDWELVEL